MNDYRKHISVQRAFGYFAWVLALSIPFYLWAIFWSVPLLWFRLPATVGMIVLPAAVSTVRRYREGGSAAVWALWRRAGDIDRVRGVSPVAVALLTIPIVAIASFAVMRWFDIPLPAETSVAWQQAPLIFTVFGLGAIFEESGWTGYATGPPQESYGFLHAGLLIGIVWAGWHVPIWWLGQGHNLLWVASQFIFTVALRVIMGWVYANGGRSVFLATAFHATANTTYALFPNEGSHYDPTIFASLLGLAAGFVALASRRRV